MGKMLSVHHLQKQHLEAIREAAPGWEVIDASGKKDTLEQQLPGTEILLGWSKKAETLLLQEGTTLKWIQSWSAGVENLPLKRLRELDITLTNASGVHPFPISEHIFAYLLSFARCLPQAIRNQSARKWGIPGAQISEVHGKTIGILGVGAIGSETARLAKAFQMKVYGLRRSGRPDPWVDQMVEMDGLMQMLPLCDYIVNCLPLTAETENMLGKEQFAAMKPGAVYISIGRGRTTDTSALLDALENGTLAGAGLDVFEEEPLPAEHPLWGMEQVIITPHNAGDTPDYDDRLIEVFCTNLKKYASGSPLTVNVVDLDHQY